jgi:hypothetical protein
MLIHSGGMTKAESGGPGAQILAHHGRDTRKDVQAWVKKENLKPLQKFAYCIQRQWNY